MLHDERGEWRQEGKLVVRVAELTMDGTCEDVFTAVEGAIYTMVLSDDQRLN